MQSVEGTVAVITGAGSGIGRATAHSLARRGGIMLVSDLDASRAEAVAREISELGGHAASAPRCDVASDGDVSALAQTAMSTFGRVDIVMSNVGVIAKGLPLEIPMEAWSSIIDVNLLGTVRVLRAFLPAILEQGTGHVVTTGSTAGLFPYAFDRMPYAATKAAVIALTESLALYLRPRGIGVTCFCPAGVITNIVEQVREYGPPTPIQAPQLPLITAEEAGELVVQGILEDRLLVLTDPAAASMIERHATDREEFIRAQIEYIEGRNMTADDRWARGVEMFTDVTGMPAPNRGDDYVADVVIDQVFAEIWTRPGLTRKERRWIAITCACMAGAPFAMETHLGVALRTGDISLEELQEFVIHFAVYAGHPKATAARAVRRGTGTTEDALNAGGDAGENVAMTSETFELSLFPAHLGLGAKVERLDAFDGTPDWYMRYGAAHASDGNEGRLVSMHTFDTSWDSWEMHPSGDELVLCVDGVMTLHQEVDGEQRTVTLRAGEAVINTPGTWHTADVDGRVTAVFVTAGAGTQNRPR